MLAVSQFTLLGDTRKGNRPSFIAAAPPELGRPLYERFVATLRELGVEVATGRFGASMRVALQSTTGRSRSSSSRGPCGSVRPNGSGAGCARRPTRGSGL